MNLEPLHLVTLEPQHVLSHRFCDICGCICWHGVKGSAHYWTANAMEWANNPNNCNNIDLKGNKNAPASSCNLVCVLS